LAGSAPLDVVAGTARNARKSVRSTVRGGRAGGGTQAFRAAYEISEPRPEIRIGRVFEWPHASKSFQAGGKRH